MNKIYCDLCKKEINDTYLIEIKYYRNFWIGSLRKDVCKECNVKIAKFITKLEK